MTIKDCIQSLTSAQREQLMHAFNNEFSQIVSLVNDFILAVHLPSTENIEVIEESGCWTYGKRKVKDNC
jgi:hypothetical protein